MSTAQTANAPTNTAALVTSASLRPDLNGRYLLVPPRGAPVWVADPAEATPFDCMKEAMRMALRLPAEVKAYGMPRAVELHAVRLH
jgi:hypothetical protein